MLARSFVLLAAATANKPTPPTGPYEVYFQNVKKVEVMDRTDQTISVWMPIGTEGQMFPLISYSHGFSCGGSYEPITHGPLLKGIAGFGYVVIAHESCSFGCSDHATRFMDPTGFKNMYKEQLKAIEWARNETELFASVDFELGVGVAGHSMGGQATLYSSSEAGAGHDIRAAVMHHAYTHSYPAPTVPFLAFTGTTDHIASHKMSERFFNTEGAYPVKGLVNKKHAGHMEPLEPNDPRTLVAFTAAWFKLFLDKTPQADGFDYHDMIFGSGDGSLCSGGDGDMKACELYDKASTMLV